MKSILKILLILLISLNIIYCDEDKHYYKVSWDDNNNKCLSTKLCSQYSIEKINLNNFIRSKSKSSSSIVSKYNHKIQNKLEQEDNNNNNNDNNNNDNNNNNNINNNNINSINNDNNFQSIAPTLNKIPIYQLLINEKSTLSKIKSYFLNNESNDIIVYGDIVKQIVDRKTSLNNLNVLRVYKQLPLGNRVETTDRYYTFSNSNFPCLERPNLKRDKPCFPIISTMVNFNSYNYLISKLIYPYSENVGQFFDSRWLDYKSLTDYDGIGGKLIALGTINNKYEVIVSNAYINIPDPIQQCPSTNKLQCNSSQIATNSRDVNRCLINSTCTLISFSNNTIDYPQCPKGYYLTFFTGNNGGILEFNCDANFLAKTY
ncbi:hypothetical protein RB653_002209 [Dictyostelium firmibasis]|uniref:Uncharacterized protein n=1 Tax=Dictyostelium firmibasis TaxID=79012 RepID=A0AAN7TXD8_9MYCE